MFNSKSHATSTYTTTSYKITAALADVEVIAFMRSYVCIDAIMLPLVTRWRCELHRCLHIKWQIRRKKTWQWVWLFQRVIIISTYRWHCKCYAISVISIGRLLSFVSSNWLAVALRMRQICSVTLVHVKTVLHLLLLK